LQPGVGALDPVGIARAQRVLKYAGGAGDFLRHAGGYVGGLLLLASSKRSVQLSAGVVDRHGPIVAAPEDDKRGGQAHDQAHPPRSIQPREPHPKRFSASG
jgi:hypothetical protein